MAARRRADVDEVKLFARQQIVDRVEPLAVGAGGEKGVPARLSGVSRSDDPDIFPGAPAGHVAVGGDIAKADERAPQHGRRRDRARRRRAPTTALTRGPPPPPLRGKGGSQAAPPAIRPREAGEGDRPKDGGGGA